MLIEGLFVTINPHFTSVYVGHGIIDAHDAAMKAWEIAPYRLYLFACRVRHP